MMWSSAVLFASLVLRLEARRIARAAAQSAIGRCDPTVATDAEMEAIFQTFVDDDALASALQQNSETLAGMGLGEGTAELPAPSDAFNPYGFCPLSTKEERAAAAETAGGGPLKLFQAFDEFNTGLLDMTGMPINPATDPTLLESGPLHVDHWLFEALNKHLPTWDTLRRTGFLTMALPAFLLTDGKNRTSFFMNSAFSACWDPDMLGLGPMKFKFQEVLAGVSDPNQRRGYYTATVNQHPDFFHPDTILFQDGGRHYKYRHLFELSGFARRYPVDVEVARQIPVAEGCEVPDTDVFSTHVGRLVQMAIWGSDPPEEIMDEIRTYGARGPLGIFGDVIQPVLNLPGIAGAVRQAKDNVAKWALTTPFADVFFKARDHLLADDPFFSSNDILIDSIGVASLFAGLVGTVDMTTKCVSFQKLETRHHDFFMQDPEKYLIELMRFDSAVTSTTELLQAETQIVLEGRNITLKAGSPQQLILATANRDPSFWHNPSDFNPERSQLAETLAWNGRAEDVEARSLEKAPRHCPGMCLSLKVAAAACASMMGVFDELLDAGKILANGGLVRCNNFGEHEEPELWTPAASR